MEDYPEYDADDDSGYSFQNETRVVVTDFLFAGEMTFEAVDVTNLGGAYRDGTRIVIQRFRLGCGHTIEGPKERGPDCDICDRTLCADHGQMRCFRCNKVICPKDTKGLRPNSTAEQKFPYCPDCYRKELSKKMSLEFVVYFFKAMRFLIRSIFNLRK